MRLVKPSLQAITVTATLVLNSITLTGGVVATVSAGEAYKWVDDNGTIHYAAHPPKNREAQKVKTYSSHRTPTPHSSPVEKKNQKTTASAPTAEAAPQQFKDPERCAQARKNLATLQQYARVRSLGEDGQPYYLTPEQKQEHIVEAQQAIKESC